MLRALLERGIVPGPRGRHLDRRDQRRGGRGRPDAGRRRAPGEHVVGRSIAATSSTGSLLGRLATLARTRTHLHGNDAAARAADRGAARRADRGPAVRVPVRRGVHRAALASTGSPTGRSSTRCSPRRPSRASCRRSRSAASTSSTAAIVNSIPVSRAVAARRAADLRPARRPPRPAARAAALAVGGRARRVRDRAPAPLRRRPRRAARRHRGARDADRPAGAAALQRPLAVPLPRHVARRRAHRARPRGVACATSTSTALGAA